MKANKNQMTIATIIIMIVILHIISCSIIQSTGTEGGRILRGLIKNNNSVSFKFSEPRVLHPYDINQITLVWSIDNDTGGEIGQVKFGDQDLKYIIACQDIKNSKKISIVRAYNRVVNNMESRMSKWWP